MDTANKIFRIKINQLNNKRRPYIAKGKKLIYFSQPEGGGVKNYNARIEIDQTQIVCRHLAFEQLRLGKNYSKAFSSEEAILQNEALQSDFFDKQRVQYKANNYYLFHLSQFGECIFEICKQMKPNTTKTLLLSTVIHTMSITIKYKAEKSGIVIKFYDPNLTNIHRRVLCRRIANLRNLEIDDFIEQKGKNTYFSQLETAVLMVYNDLNKLEGDGYGSKMLNFNFLSKNRQPITLEDKANALHHFFRFNDKDAVSDIVDKVLKNISNDKKVRLLQAIGNDFPGLQIALQEDHAETVTIFMQKVLGSNLSNKQKMELLVAKDAQGLPGLALAMQIGCRRSVNLFTQEILESNLSAKEKVELLSPKSLPLSGKKEILGLAIALQKNHTEMIIDFFRLIINSKLPDAKKIELLAIKVPYFNITILCNALMVGHTAVALEIIKLVMTPIGTEKTPLINESTLNEWMIQYFEIALASKSETNTKTSEKISMHSFLFAVIRNEELLAQMEEVLSSSQRKTLYTLISEQEAIIKKAYPLNEGEVKMLGFDSHANLWHFINKSLQKLKEFIGPA